MPDQARKGLEKLIAAEMNFVVLRLQVFRDCSGVGKFAVGLLAVTDRECLDRLFSNSRGESGDGARIKAAAQKNAERNIAHQMAGNATFEFFTVAADIVFARLESVVGFDVQVPIR